MDTLFTESWELSVPLKKCAFITHSFLSLFGLCDYCQGCVQWVLSSVFFGTIKALFTALKPWLEEKSIMHLCHLTLWRTLCIKCRKDPIITTQRIFFKSKCHSQVGKSTSLSPLKSQQRCTPPTTKDTHKDTNRHRHNRNTHTFHECSIRGFQSLPHHHRHPHFTHQQDFYLSSLVARRSANLAPLT